MVQTLNQQVTPSSPGGVVVSLPPGSILTTVTPVPLNNTAPLIDHVMVVIPNGTVTGGAVQLQGSLDGGTWTNLGSAINPSTATLVVNITDQPWQYLQALITSNIMGGGSVSAQIASGG